MSLGADDYIVKPFNNVDLVTTIEKRLGKFKAIKENSNREFDRLFDLSPEGILIFDGKTVYKSNSAFRKLINYDQEDMSGVSLDKLLDSESFQKLVKSFPLKKDENNELFNGTVNLVRINSEEIQMKLVVSEFDKFSNYTLYIGLLSSINRSTSAYNGNQFVAEVCSLLNRENITITEALGEKITNIFRQNSGKLKNPKNNSFTTRENQVLHLSMEGYPIKNIADRLAISDRTVEKYRTKLMEKTKSSNMIEVIVYALKNGLVEI